MPPNLCDAALALIRQARSTVELLQYVEGPDFPTGGNCHPTAGNPLLEFLQDGRGGLPGSPPKWEIEDTGRGGYQIVVTEMPYQCKSRGLIEKIAELLIARRLRCLDDVRRCNPPKNVRLV